MPSDAVEQKFKWLCATLDKCVLDRDALIAKCAAYMILYRGECQFRYAVQSTQKVSDNLAALRVAAIDRLSASEKKARKSAGTWLEFSLKLAKQRNALRDSTRRAGRQRGADLKRQGDESRKIVEAFNEYFRRKGITRNLNKLIAGKTGLSPDRVGKIRRTLKAG